MKVSGKVVALTFLLLLRKILRIAAWRQHSAFVMRRPIPRTTHIKRIPELLMYLTREIIVMKSKLENFDSVASRRRLDGRGHATSYRRYPAYFDGRRILGNTVGAPKARRTPAS
jgi:hypothetical protein